MAIYFWKLCVGWTVYLLCLLTVQSTSTSQDESYFKYNLLGSVRQPVDFEFIENNDVQHSRQKRSFDEQNGRASVSQLKTVVNSSLQNSPSSNVASASTSSEKPLPLSNEERNNNVRSVTMKTFDDEIDGGDLPPDEMNRLQTFKQVMKIGSAKIPVYDPTRAGGSSSNNSIIKNSATSNANNTSAYVSPTTGQIVSATFDSNSKTGSVIGSAVDTSKDKDSEVSINQFPDEITNETLKHENITKALKDHHIYYNSTFIVDEKIGQQYWVELADNSDTKIHDMLSDSHRRAATVQLSFDFPFYGYLVTNVTIATGGFLFTGDHIHSWLAATQYIAPLMANFDNRISKDSFVKYLDNGTAFIVLWENVVLRDSPEFGNFTFEAILHKNGDIAFIYKNIPVAVENIKDDQHPVKVGLSDAYIIDRTIFFVKRKTIYEYHRVNFMREDIKNWTVIYLEALPTCHDMKTCDTCVNANVNLGCKWCPAVERCSTGLDRSRQEWLSHECDKAHVLQCNESPPPPYAHKAAEENIITTKLDGSQTGKTVVGTSGVISLLLVMTSLAGAALIFLYAYRNPHSTPGQLLIRYRPSQWRWRRGEARYTAATIHM